MPTCIEWGEERHQECTETEDQGYDECTRTRDEGYKDCCDWVPCSWLCDAWTWVSNIVCVAWTWVSNIVCIAWTWITTAVCVTWDIFVTVVNAALVTIESVLGWVLSGVAVLVELFLAIPVVGTLVRWILNFITHVVFIAGSLVDAGLGLIGIRPEKILRVCTVILSDEDGEPVASIDFARTILQLACDVYKRDANVRIIRLGPFKYSTGFMGAEKVDDNWIQVDDAESDSSLLDVPCNGGADWLGAGAGFQTKSSWFCFFGSWRRVSGYGAPVTCFIVRSIPAESDTAGCGLWITDYATIVGQTDGPPVSPRVLGHEVGHNCNLYHVCVDLDSKNLMATRTGTDVLSPCDSEDIPDTANPRMDNQQVIAVRASKHVTYF